MDLDRILSAADAISADMAKSQRENDQVKARQRLAQTQADKLFVHEISKWVILAAQRLGEAGIPRCIAVEMTAPPVHPHARTGTESRPRRGLFRPRSPRLERETPAHQTEIQGWIVQACLPPLSNPTVLSNSINGDPDGRPTGHSATRAWGDWYNYDTKEGGFFTVARVMVSEGSGAYVVAETYPISAGLGGGRVMPESRFYSLNLPPGSRMDYVPGGDLIGKRLSDLSRREMLSLAAVDAGTIAPLLGIKGTAYYPQMVDRWPDNAALYYLTDEQVEETLSGQLIIWELGVRYIMTRHAKGLPWW